MLKKIAIVLILLSSSLCYSQYFKRAVVPKSKLTAIEEYRNSGRIVLKLSEELSATNTDYSLFSDKLLLNKIELLIGTIDHTIKQYVNQDVELLRRLKIKGEQHSQRKLPDLTLYYEINISSGTEQQRLDILNQLLKLNEVETAYFNLKYEKIEGAAAFEKNISEFNKMSVTPDYSYLQEYQNPAPLGIDAKYAWTKPGGDGTGVKMADVEIANYLQHEDLVGQNIKDVHTKVPDDSHIHHALAAMGEILAEDNGFGMKGIAYNCEGYFSSICLDSVCAVENLVQGLTAAIPYLGPGDVLLTELQTVAPLPFGMPVEYDQAEFDVVITAVANGIIVMEPAGNGNKDMDDYTKYEHRFDTTFRYSGAFIVGSCYPKKVSVGRQARSKYYSSSYGKRVDFYSWGEKIPSLGYGTLSGTSYLDYYSDDFCCTSGATPIVTGSVILMQSIHKNTTGNILNTDILRHLLKSTGTPSYDPPADMIGVQPDLKKAIDLMLLSLGTASPQEKSPDVYLLSQFFTDHLDLYSRVDADKNVEIYALTGAKLMQTRIELTSSTAIQIPLNGLAEGVYFIKISDSKSSAMFKVIKY